ncbi:MAG: phosphate/phosphite/phosphonate ABC transporter substrate-binding protein [Xanthomonadales bacterium]|nr:phosphate/phosphite/phosphonate ABC transporter substrate-binding protein [Xanthomonadales bacterium]
MIRAKAAIRALAPFLAIGIALIILAACKPAKQPGSGGVELVVSVLPNQSPEQLKKKYRGLLTHLEKHTGYSLSLEIQDDYESFSDAFASGSVDLGWFGGLTFVRAQDHGAEALVQRDVDARFISLFVTRTGSDLQSLADLEGQTFTFGSRLSTSGHLMPRVFLQRNGIVPEQYFSAVSYTSGHDETMFDVRDGRADAGAVNSVIMRSMLDNGTLQEGQLTVVASTLPYSNYVWGVRSDMDPAVKTALRDAFLSLDRGSPEDALILGAHGASYFMPVTSRVYEDVKAAAAETGLLN